MKIIHLSDTHIGFQDNHLRMQHIVDDLTKIRPCDPTQHLVIHTGDMVQDSANLKELVLAKAALETLKAFGYRVLICPGNHDYGDSKYTKSSLARRYREVFKDFFYLMGPATKRISQADDIFPVLHIIDNIALIGLDTCWKELGWFSGWWAEGQIGDTQLAMLNSMLDNPELTGKKVVIYLHHHPYSYSYAVKPLLSDPGGFFHGLYSLTRKFRRLKDAYSFSQTIRDRAHVLLFGHMHYGLDCSIESNRYGVAMALDGSSTTASLMDTDRMRYRIIDVEKLIYETRSIKL